METDSSFGRTQNTERKVLLRPMVLVKWNREIQFFYPPFMVKKEGGISGILRRSEARRFLVFPKQTSSWDISELFEGEPAGTRERRYSSASARDLNGPRAVRDYSKWYECNIVLVPKRKVRTTAHFQRQFLRVIISELSTGAESGTIIEEWK